MKVYTVGQRLSQDFYEYFLWNMYSSVNDRILGRVSHCVNYINRLCKFVVNDFKVYLQNFVIFTMQGFPQGTTGQPTKEEIEIDNFLFYFHALIPEALLIFFAFQELEYNSSSISELVYLFEVLNVDFSQYLLLKPRLWLCDQIPKDLQVKINKRPFHMFKVQRYNCLVIVHIIFRDNSKGIIFINNMQCIKVH